MPLTRSFGPFAKSINWIERRGQDRNANHCHLLQSARSASAMAVMRIALLFL